MRNRAFAALFALLLLASPATTALGAGDVSFTGEVKLSGQPASDGTTFSYDLTDLDSASTPTVEFTGETATEWDNETSAGVSSGSSLDLSVAGDQDPTGPSVNGEPVVEFTGTEQTTSWSASATGATSGSTKSVSVPGNVDPDAETVEFTGTEQTTARTVSQSNLANGDSFSYSVGGNIPATNPQVTFTGDSTTASGSGSGTGSGSVDVGGNLQPTDESVSVTGDTSTTSQTLSGSIPAGGSDSISLTSNLDPNGPSANGEPTIQVTASNYSPGAASWNFPSDQYDPNTHGILIDVKKSSIEELKLTGAPNLEGATEIEVRRESDGDLLTSYSADPNNGKTVTIPWEQGTGEYAVVVPDATNTDYPVPLEDFSNNEVSNADGNIVAIGEYVGGSIAKGDRASLRVFSAVDYVEPPGSPTISASDGTSVSFSSMSNGETVTKEFDITESATSLSVSANSGQYDFTLDYTERTATEDPSIDIDGDGTAEASWSGIYSAGASTTTKSVGGLSVGDNSVSTSTTNGPQPDWSLSWTERTATEDPSIDLDGDGSTDASYTGVLKSGETHTASVSDLSTGSHTASVSTGHQVDVDIDMTVRTASEDPGLDLDGDGVTDASYSGILRSGETASVSAETLSEGSTTLETSLTAGSVDYTVSATGRTHTEDPSVDLDGDGSTEVSHSGIISPGATETYELADLSTSTSSATVSTAAGTSDVSFRFKERQRSVDPAIIINGNRAGYTGTLDDGQTVQVDGSSSWLASGDNTVEVRVGEGVSSDAPNPQVQMVYTHDATDRINQTYTDETWSERYNVEKQFNASQNDVTVDLDHSSEIVAVRSLEYRTNGGSWQELTSQAYELNGTTVRADIGDVQAGDTVEVRDAASKVQVHNGEITVEETTAPGQRLDTAIRMDSWSSDSYIKVRNSSDLVRYTYNESWSAPDEYVEIYETGEQRLYMPGASGGSLARVSTIPVEVDAETGGARVSVEDPTRSEPEFVVDPGPGGSGDTVAFTYLNAQDDTDYVLWSATEEIVRDSGTANSPITLTDDDSDETLAFLIDDTGSSGPTNETGPTSLDELSGAAQGAVGSTSLGDVGIIVVVAVVIAGAWVISRQFGDANLGWQTLFVAEAVVGGVLALELLSQYSLAGGIAVGFARFLEGVGLGLAEAMPLALIVVGALGYLAVRRWGRPQVVVNRSFSLGGSERGENRK
ncbi:hypothetical protein [Haloarcula mannanilytica]|uniref:hypothetical protein n=1 Tax=Haloarcula mannanilytica TaxID=2509225 RepID=UPI0010F815DD|nr:hypothetical protein [Haloarcula mannanilytica]